MTDSPDHIRSWLAPGSVPRTSASVRATDWHELDPVETTDALETLEDWVRRTTERYHLDHRHIPDCWPEHGELVEELSALHTAWRRAFAADATGDLPLRWHEQFHTTRDRLAFWVARTGCRPGAHRTTSPT